MQSKGISLGGTLSSLLLQNHGLPKTFDFVAAQDTYAEGLSLLLMSLVQVFFADGLASAYFPFLEMDRTTSSPSTHDRAMNWLRIASTTILVAVLLMLIPGGPAGRCILVMLALLVGRLCFRRCCSNQAMAVVDQWYTQCSLTLLNDEYPAFSGTGYCEAVFEVTRDE